MPTLRRRAFASITPEERHEIVLCQGLGPAAPCDICGVDCSTCNCRRRGWEAARAIDWQAYAQGEYVGHERLAHVPEYRLRVDDQLDMTYRLTREETSTPYKLNVGDEVQVESFTDPDLNRNLLIQPDGTITLAALGPSSRHRPHGDPTPRRARRSLQEVLQSARRHRHAAEGQHEAGRLAGDRSTAGPASAARASRSASRPKARSPCPAIGSVQAQGLTLPELQTELNESYRQVVEGIQVIPILVQRAPRYVYVLGEVNNPGRFELVAPTTAIQAISMAGSWRVGANLRQIVVFRRGDDWRLLATMINLEGALLGNQPCPRGEIWIDDSDVVIVPKSKILIADDFINLVFTRGIYGVFPMNATLNFAKISSL